MKNIAKTPQIPANIYTATVYQLIIPLLILWLSRLLFYFYNRDAVGEVAQSQLWRMMMYGLNYDVAALLTVNSLFIALRLLPLPELTNTRRWWRMTNVIYCLTNTVMLVAQFGDTAFYRFNGNRMQLIKLAELTDEPNVMSITASYFVTYWWAVIAVACLVLLLVATTMLIRVQPLSPTPPRRHSSLVWAFFLGGMLLTWLGARGMGRNYLEPLDAETATAYVNRNCQAPVVQNTPFTLLHSYSLDNRIAERHYFSADTLALLRSSLHIPSKTSKPNRRNVMLIIIESGGAFQIDALNPLPGRRQHLMPFLDSLARVSLTVPHYFATGVRSNEGIATSLGGFPNFDPFIYMRSSYTGNANDGMFRMARRLGYSTAFFYGAMPGSYLIEGIARNFGAERTYNRNDYGSADFDGHWGVFDHAMAEFVVAHTAGTQRRAPFFNVWFTLSSHAPYPAPDYWQTAGYRSQPGTMDRSVEYADRSLRHFFELARTQSWYDHTTFIIVADHGNRERPNTDWNTPWVQTHIPFIVYTPDGSVAPHRLDDRVMGQIDLLPTVLGLMGCNKEFVAMGCDVLARDFRPATHYALSKLMGEYQIVGTRYVVHWDDSPERVTAVFDPWTDPLLHTPLTTYDAAEVARMTTWTKALLQDFAERINGRRMSAR